MMSDRDNSTTTRLLYTLMIVDMNGATSLSDGVVCSALMHYSK